MTNVSNPFVQLQYYFKDYPHALAKCLRALDWTTNEAAHEMADMLKLWAPLQPEDALELLDAAFADQTIRLHAVQYLEPISDDQLLSYLLQLVQVMKYESYLDCDLARFLLRRALKSQRIGHFFFWYSSSTLSHQPLSAAQLNACLHILFILLSHLYIFAYFTTGIFVLKCIYPKHVCDLDCYLRHIVVDVDRI